MFILHNRHIRLDETLILFLFEEIELYADRCGFTLPHLHPTPEVLNHLKTHLVQWMKDNPDFKDALKQHLRLDYKLREKCQSVQSRQIISLTKATRLGGFLFTLLIFSRDLSKQRTSCLLLFNFVL